MSPASAHHTRHYAVDVKDVSVVIPIGGPTPLLQLQLDALGRQTSGGGWELVLTFNYDANDRSWYSVPSTIDAVTSVVATGRRGASHARNAGVRAARGSVILFCDADDIVGPRWIEEMVGTLRNEDAASGTLDEETLNESSRRWRDPTQGVTPGLPVVHGFLPAGVGANFGVHRHVLQSAGGWNESLKAAEDLALSWRIQLAGYSFGFASGAVVQYRHRSSTSGLIRQFFAYGRAEPLVADHFRADGFPRSPWRLALDVAGAALLPRRRHHRNGHQLARELAVAAGAIVEATSMSARRLRRSTRP